MEPKDHRDDDYLPCHQYVREIPDETGITRFENEGKYYFSFIEDEEIILRSEGYATEAGRENGVASVLKNINNEELYDSRKLPDGRWVLCLKSPNHQEISRSCPHNTHEEVLVLMPGARARKSEMLALASIEAGQRTQKGVAFGEAENTSEKVEDDYMICREYEEKTDYKHRDYDDFIIFQHENTGKYYFAMVNTKNEIVLRSEGYPNTSARDNGLESVRKNREIENRLFVEEKRGLHYLVLKAGNHQEIARSCPFKTAEEAWVIWKADQKSISSEKVEDDYMICREYEEKTDYKHGDYDDFIIFQHENTGKYYFAMVNTKNEIVLRSEGYPNTSTRDNGLESVRKNREIENRLFVEEKRDLYYLVLKAGNHQEIARSCPKVSEGALWAIWKDTGLNLPLAAAGFLGIVPGLSTTSKVEKEDDYLPCDAYKNHNVNDKTNKVAFFSKDNLNYFVIYNSDGSVRLRSEGFINTFNRDQELTAVLKYIDNEDQYESIDKAGYRILILKDEEGREIGRSCSEIIVAPLVGAYASAGKTGAENQNKGINWWWLLLPLLLLLGFLLFTKTCKKTDEERNSTSFSTENSVSNDVVSDQNSSISGQVESPENAVSSTLTAEKTNNTPDCGLNWILFEYDKFDISSNGKTELEQMAKVLTDNNTWTAILSAHTDAKGSNDYNNILSNKRAEEAKRILVSLGVNAERIKTTAASESKPIAKNTDDDSGRHFNRRVELHVYDASGNETCKSIAPNVPGDLKPQ